MSDTTIALTPHLYAYLKANSLREPEVLIKLRQETQTIYAAAMQISPEQGQFMRLLIELMGARKTLDIGTFTGYSSISVALALPEDGTLIACDNHAEWTAIAKKYWQMAGVAHKVELRLGPALQTLDELLGNGEGGTFDFSFIDADKQNYNAYYEKSLALLRVGGLIAIDNVLWGGDVADASVDDRDTVIIRELNAKIFHDERVTVSMLPIGDGLTLARKR